MVERAYVKMRLYFASDKLDFERMNEVVGFKPTRIKHKEDCRLKEYACDSWRYEIGYERTCDIRNQTEKMMNQIAPRSDIIREYCENNDIEASFVFILQTATESLPILTLPKEFVALAAKIDAKITFDIYSNLGDEVDLVL